MLHSRDKEKKKWKGFLLGFLLIFTCTNVIFHQWIAFPSEIRLFQGKWKQLDFPLPVTATTNVRDSQIARANGSMRSQVPVAFRKPFSLKSDQIGQTQVTLKLFGKLPIKQLLVRVIPEIQVVPGGQSIGIKMKSSGVLVVGHYTDSDRVKKEIQVGDYITQINQKPIQQIHDLIDAVKEAGQKRKSLHLLVLHDGKTKKVRLRPFFDKKEKAYRLGLYIRDSAAGVGTLTFYDPKKKVYGALGHMITDIDTGQRIRVGHGKLIRSNVTSIQKGESGEPGEKRAIFFDEKNILGNISKNTPFGVFGKMFRIPTESIKMKPVPIALADEVKEGPAKMLTVIDGQKVQAFDIQIVHATKQKQPATKGMIVKVTDPRLLDKTGGIVQGMSGSPILQNGKLVGAITHVFVNDPSSGYGTFIEWMLQDAGVISKKTKRLSNREPFSVFHAGKSVEFIKCII